ncbi:MAG: hypothetical protein ABI382_09955 [Nakamurella sp.]
MRCSSDIESNTFCAVAFASGVVLGAGEATVALLLVGDEAVVLVAAVGRLDVCGEVGVEDGDVVDGELVAGKPVVASREGIDGMVTSLVGSGDSAVEGAGSDGESVAFDEEVAGLVTPDSGAALQLASTSIAAMDTTVSRRRRIFFSHISLTQTCND